MHKHAYYIEFANSGTDPLFLQIDPWACLYRVECGDRIVFEVRSESETPRFTIDEIDDKNRIITFLDALGFYVVLDGECVHWQQFPTNM